MSDDQNIIHAESPGPCVPDVSLGEFILQTLLTRGNAVAQIENDTGDTLTYSEMLSKSIVIAQHMLRLGIRPSDVVGISSGNNLDYIVIVVASQLIGAVFAPYNPAYTEGELHHGMTISLPRIVFATSKTIEAVAKVSRQLNCVRDIVLIGRDASLGVVSEHPTISQLLSSPLAPESQFVPSRVNPKTDTAVILCSSGTTGLPKGVELTHHNFITYLLHVTSNPLYRESFQNGGIVLGIMPFFHGYGFGLLLSSIILGSKVIVFSRFQDHVFLKNIQDHKVSVLFLVPPLVFFLGKDPAVDSYDLRHVKTIISSAAPLSKESQELVTKRLGVQDFRQMYGMTETSILATDITGINKIGSVGRLLGGLTAKIIDEETGRSLPRLERGELCIKGPIVMKGYRNNPNETNAIIDPDGWLHTGDIGYFDHDGCLFIVDRLKELIKYKGFQVAPAELETILCNHPEIRDAGVFGIKDESSGELPYGHVVLQPNSNLTEKDVLDYVNVRVSSQKKLRGVKFVSEIPRNPSGKILRRELRSSRL